MKTNHLQRRGASQLPATGGAWTTEAGRKKLLAVLDAAERVLTGIILILDEDSAAITSGSVRKAMHSAFREFNRLVTAIVDALHAGATSSPARKRTSSGVTPASGGRTARAARAARTKAK